MPSSSCADNHGDGALEVELDAELGQSRRYDGKRLQPAGVVVVDRQGGAAVEGVEQVEIDGGAGLPEFQDLPDAQVELVQPTAVQRPRLDERHVDVLRI